MNFPPYWALGRRGLLSCWRWSNNSLDEAKALADAAAARLAERFAAGKFPENRYAYADRPLREQILREFRDGDAHLAAVITRNAYGCRVLNTARVMFLDVDFPEPQSMAGRLWGKLLGKTPRPAPAQAEAAAVAAAEGWVRRDSSWGWRIYRTKAGLRLMATHALFSPESVKESPLSDALGVDPLYRRLCGIQQCFRARLTPKPWRCGMPVPPVRWPWPDAGQERRFQQWEERYESACRQRAVCSFVAAVGNPSVHPEVQMILACHDETTGALSKMELA